MVQRTDHLFDSYLLELEWDKATRETVQNCFKKAGICSETQANSLHDLDNPFLTLGEEVQSLREAHPEAVKSEF